MHQGQQVLITGKVLEEASAAMIMIHGRGASAASILELGGEFDAPEFAFVAPQAAGSVWYPYPFMYPIEQNEPALSSALATVGEVFKAVETAGIPAEKIMLLGFSQGACLASEFAARNTRRYGGLIVLSGGLIGPPGTPRTYPGSLEGTPVFIGCSDIDPHIPLTRVKETSVILESLGAKVTERIYPGMGHTVNIDEIKTIQELMAALVAPS
jgi:predicted esterase